MKRIAFFVVVFVALVSTALAVAARDHRISARLTTRVEIPRPVHAKKAVGAFSGSFVEHSTNVRLTSWLPVLRSASCTA